MSLQNVTDLSCTQETKQVATEKKHDKQKSIAEITLLVISLLVCFVGLGFLIWGVIQSTTLLIVMGSGLVAGGLVGFVIANLLIRLSKRKEKLLLLREQELLEQATRPLQKSFLMDFLIRQVSEKERELKDQEKALQDLMSKYQQDIQTRSGQVTECTIRLNDLEKEKILLKQRLQEFEDSHLIIVKDALKQELEEKTGKCRVLQTKVQTGNEEQKALKDKCSKLEKQLQAKEKELMQKEKELNQREQKQVQAVSSEESLVFEDAHEFFEDKE